MFSFLFFLSFALLYLSYDESGGLLTPPIGGDLGGLACVCGQCLECGALVAVTLASEAVGLYGNRAVRAVVYGAGVGLVDKAVGVGGCDSDYVGRSHR